MPSLMPTNPANPWAEARPELPVTSLAVLALLLAVAVHYEIRERRIPNWLTRGGMLLGLGLAGFQGGSAFASSVVGLVIGFGFFFVFYVFGGVGGGDVKLMGASGALLGANLAPAALVYTAFLGALLALFLVIWRRDFWARVAAGLRRLAFWQTRAAPVAPAPPPVSVPYGIAIALGCLLAVLLGEH